MHLRLQVDYIKLGHFLNYILAVLKPPRTVRISWSRFNDFACNNRIKPAYTFLSKTGLKRRFTRGGNKHGVVMRT
jgi:hypothetical protein